MMATVETLRIHGHPYSEICNESIIEVLPWQAPRSRLSFSLHCVSTAPAVAIAGCFGPTLATAAL